MAATASCATTADGQPPAGDATTSRPTRCVYNRPANATGDPCQPRPTNGPARAALTTSQQASAEPARAAAERAITGCGGCGAGDPVALAENIRAALAGAGFADAIVRPAGPADPAPTGSVIYAVPAGVACLLGSYEPSTRRQQLEIQGPLTHGGCL
ncbi:hypothetical protein Ais01nite_13330 [Asanoa ishikariensis]|nr:hypothetical protein Ais01nite_13330 [Asanoa ishikariensis]